MSLSRPVKLSRFLINALRLTEARQIIKAQQDLLQAEYEIVEALRKEQIDLELSYTRISRDLIWQFIIALDQPEYHEDIRHKLHLSLRDFNDQVARLEEQTR